MAPKTENTQFLYTHRNNMTNVKILKMPDISILMSSKLTVPQVSGIRSKIAVYFQATNYNKYFIIRYLAL